ncbi:MAG: hypothetical protein AB7P76_03875 [Candidatus Melainabacteria bacterium]
MVVSPFTSPTSPHIHLPPVMDNPRAHHRAVFLTDAMKAPVSGPDLRDAFRQPDTRKSLAAAAGLLAGGVLLRRLPARPGTFRVFSADWKDWARVVLGVGAVAHVNKALDWKPSPAVGALETVSVLTPLSMGLNRRMWPQLAVMAGLVPGLVSFTSRVSNWIDKRLNDQPGWVSLLPKLGVAAGAMGLGLTVYPRLFSQLARWGVLGQAARTEAARGGKVLLGAGAAVCARGCCPAAFCLSELGEMLGGMLSWLKGHTGHPSNPQPNRASQEGVT